MMKIEISFDYAKVEGQILYRPSHISRSKWAAFWEAVIAMQAIA